MKKKWSGFLCLFIVLFIVFFNMTVVHGEEEWTKQTINPNLTTELDEYYLHYTYGMSTHKNKAATTAPTGLPNVYLENKETGKLTQHIYGFSNNVLSTSSFMLGLKKPNTTNTYEVFSSLYTNATVYTSGNTIKATSNKTVSGYGSFRYENYLTPKTNGRINHKYVIINTGTSSLTFRAMKNVDTELDGNDAIPVLMYGYNEGLYMETDKFSIIYDFNLPYGPHNFTNYYKTYRAPTADTSNHTVFYPYNPATIKGTGAEALGYAPNESVMGTPNDTGIYMKWDEQTLEPGESATFEYDVVLSTSVSSTYTVNNLTTTNGINYVDDVLTYEHNIQLPLTTTSIDDNNSFIEEKIPDGMEIEDTFVKFKNSQNSVVKAIPISLVYEDTTRMLKIPIANDDIDKASVHLEYNMIPKKELGNRVATHIATYQINTPKKNYSWENSLVVPVAMPEASPVQVSYVDEFGNLLNLDNNEMNPFFLIGEYGNPYQAEVKSITGYELVDIQGETTGDFSRDIKEIKYVYTKKKYIINFETTGGSLIDSQSVSFQESVSIPNSPIYEGKVFKGWYVDEDLTKEYDFSSKTIENMTIYAKWQTCVYTPDGTISVGENTSSHKDMLRIQYVSDFQFGSMTNTINDLSIRSQADNFDNKKVAPFISIIDDRSASQVSTWRLTANRNEFITNSNQKLSDTKLLLNNIDIKGNAIDNLSVVNEEIVLKSDEDTIICEVNEPLSLASYSLVMGNLDQNSTTSGVTLEIPGGFSKETNRYVSTINWNIVLGGP